MAKRGNETFTVRIVSKWVRITVDGVGRTIAWGAICSVTFLGALYLYMAF
jgi:hypothetical protein